MAVKGNKDYGEIIAGAVLAAVDDPKSVPLKRVTWLDDWTKPQPVRSRSRRWLSMWLKGDLRGIPTNLSARYLREMANDLEAAGINEAVDRFIDKILPRIISNGCPEEWADGE